jgi:hypothetical protein
MRNSISLLILTIFISGCAGYGETTKKSMMKPPFGNAEDVALSEKLWNKLNESGLNDKTATLYVGGPPHGKVREVLEGKIDNRRVIVKRNYGGAGVSIKSVSENRAKYLKAITVMAKQGDGYDADNNNWFWVKYKADGSLHKNPKGMSLAGRVAKGMDKGCIACHKSASGTDMVFAHNKEANAEITMVK